jgi:hypothetical protein
VQNGIDAHRAFSAHAARYVVRMRTLVAVVAACFLTACSSTLAEPRLLVSPYYALYQLRGEVGMQSAPGAGPVQDNAPRTLRAFGHDHRRGDVGVRGNLGGGFGGRLGV